VVYRALEEAIRLSVEAILAHDGSMSMSMVVPGPFPAPMADLWQSLYGWASAAVAAAEADRVVPPPSALAPVSLSLHSHPFIRLQQRSSPRGAFTVSFHNPLHWMLGSLLLNAIVERPHRCVERAPKRGRYSSAFRYADRTGAEVRGVQPQQL